MAKGKQVSPGLERRTELQVEGTPLDPENARRLLEENRELKRLLADRELKIQILEDLMQKAAQRSGTKPK